MSDDSNIKYVNFKYIILALPDILVKIRHCWHGSYWCKETLDTIFTFPPCGKHFFHSCWYIWSCFLNYIHYKVHRFQRKKQLVF